MKKIFAILLIVFLLAVVPMQVWAAGSASLSGPGVVRAGDTITLSFSAGGGILGGNGAISYDSSQLTFQKFSASIGSPWDVNFNEGNGKFFFNDNSMTNPITGSKTIFKVTFKVASTLQPGTAVIVSVTGVTLSDGASDSNVGTKTYSVTIAEPLSNNANLKSLTVSNAEIKPGFAATTTNYTASVPFSTNKLNVTAEAEHPGATVTVGNTSLTAGATTDVTVTVKAEDGTTKVYHIKTARAQDPNYVPSGDNSLASLEVQDFKISPAFTPDRTAYAVYLPYETEHLDISAQVADPKAKLAIPELAFIPVGETTYEFAVTAENGNVRTYTLTVFRAEAFQPDVVPTEPTEPETEPTTEPTTEPETEPTTEPTQTPTQAPTEEETPAEAERGPSLGIDFWMWILVVAMAFCAGCITILLIPKARKEY